ncbi:methionine adenosyltransferase [uncultured Megasphaera sp.]|uniref:methionine adenosyltransferase n=1 Tax=uncultured Megasphaera sp. TaxID=165188 RepID=UPI00265AF07E|nr:methionine adenosyltransferase [uncultured Megasphaera sp.]
MNQFQQTYVTSEAVTEGHPDKICDQISDAVLDAYLVQDPTAHVAVESFVSGNVLTIAGEVTSSGTVDIPAVARQVIADIGYTDPALGFTAHDCLIFTNIHQQSADIHQGVTKEAGDASVGSGDQGIMYGYATNETSNYMPITVNLAQGLVRRLDQVRHETELGKIFRPDGKSQVTMCFDSQGKPTGLRSVIVSAQHCEEIGQDELRQIIGSLIIEPVCGPWLRPQTALRINQTGRFVIGGPVGDTGLTGRKLMVDTYGTVGRHGGGAFSGKDATKVDRSAAYMARYAAKNIVAAGLCDRCEVSLAYAISGMYPEAVQIQTFGTEHVPVERLEDAVNRAFSFAVTSFIDALDLRRPQFRKTAVYGHFGREAEGFAWERLDKTETLRRFVGLI